MLKFFTSVSLTYLSTVTIVFIMRARLVLHAKGFILTFYWLWWDTSCLLYPPHPLFFLFSVTPSVVKHNQQWNVCSLAFCSQLFWCFSDRPRRRAHFHQSSRCNSRHNKYFALLWKYLNSSAFLPISPMRGVILVQRFCIPQGRHIFLHYEYKPPGVSASGGATLANRLTESLAAYTCKFAACIFVSYRPPHSATSETCTCLGFTLQWICSYTLWPKWATEEEKKWRYDECARVRLPEPFSFDHSNPKPSFPGLVRIRIWQIKVLWIWICGCITDESIHHALIMLYIIY